jgi:ketosteroid isomerase-like protein
MSTPDDILRWQIDAACRDTLARAARLTDLQDHEGFAAMFAEDAELVRPSGALLRGRAAILAAYRERPAQRLTRHLLAGTVIDVLASDEATAFTTVLLFSGNGHDVLGPQGRPARGPVIVGSFDDVLRPGIDGRWLIYRRRASFDLHAALMETPG